jgi:general stress protein YciG
MTEETPKKSKRGFALMDPEKRREIARMGGKSVPAELRSFSKSPGLAAKAGRIGGKKLAAESRSFSKDSALASEAGRKGGLAQHAGRKSKKET